MCWEPIWEPSAAPPRRHRWTLENRSTVVVANLGTERTHLIRQRSGRRSVDSSPDSNPAAMLLAGDRRSGPNPAVDRPSWILQQAPPEATDQRAQSRSFVTVLRCRWAVMIASRGVRAPFFRGGQLLQS